LLDMAAVTDRGLRWSWWWLAEVTEVDGSRKRWPVMGF
jgi:hypothetical protein